MDFKLYLDKVINLFNSSIQGKNPLIIGIIGATLVFLLWYSKIISTFISGILNRGRNNELLARIQHYVDLYHISFKEAKDRVMMDEIADALEIDEKFWHVSRNTILARGDKVSFVDKEIGLIQGTFLGLIKPAMLGYDDIYVIKIDETSMIRQAAISYVKEDTINVYK